MLALRHRKLWDQDRPIAANDVSLVIDGKRTRICFDSNQDRDVKYFLLIDWMDSPHLSTISSASHLNLIATAYLRKKLDDSAKRKEEGVGWRFSVTPVWGIWKRKKTRRASWKISWDVPTAIGCGAGRRPEGGGGAEGSHRRGRGSCVALPSTKVSLLDASVAAAGTAGRCLTCLSRSLSSVNIGKPVSLEPGTSTSATTTTTTTTASTTDRH